MEDKQEIANRRQIEDRRYKNKIEDRRYKLENRRSKAEARRQNIDDIG